MKKIILAFIYVYTCSTNAALIDNDLYTTDTVTNLDWLDLSVTDGMEATQVRSLLLTTWDSVSESWVESQFMGGGWRYATESQAIDFVVRNIGENFGLYEVGSQSSNNAKTLINLLGLTYESDIFNRYSATGLYVNDNYTLDFIKISNELNSCNGAICDIKTLNAKVGYNWDFAGGPALGSFLVRENVSSVPLPASFILFISGLGLLFSRKLKKC